MNVCTWVFKVRVTVASVRVKVRVTVAMVTVASILMVREYFCFLFPLLCDK